MTLEKGFDPYLAVGDVTVGRRDVAMLRAIDDHGSMNAAADALERSYARLQQRVVELEEALGPLVERRRGGADRGGSALTADARDLLARFDRLVAQYEGVARVDETVLSGTVVDRDGELAAVDTAAGRVRAVVPADADRAELAIRSDAVALAAPDEAPRPDGTSVRNRFPGRVAWLEEGEAVARVGVDVGAPDPLVALVTRESVRRLDLEADREVIASVKATAVRGVPLEADGSADGER